MCPDILLVGGRGLLRPGDVGKLVELCQVREVLWPLLKDIVQVGELDVLLVEVQIPPKALLVCEANHGCQGAGDKRREDR